MAPVSVGWVTASVEQALRPGRMLTVAAPIHLDSVRRQELGIRHPRLWTFTGLQLCHRHHYTYSLFRCVLNFK